MSITGHSMTCVPSRVAFLTGLMPSETEVWTNDQILNSATPTHAHALVRVDIALFKLAECI